MKRNIIFTLMLLMTNELSAGIIEVPGDYLNIQDAIKAALRDDTIIVSDGIYYEQINFLGKKYLTVASRFLIDGDVSHITNTIISGHQGKSADSGSVVYFISGENETSVLCGFTVCDGKGTYSRTFNDIEGGGIWISGSGACIKNNHITRNNIDNEVVSLHVGCQGGGIAVDYKPNPNWVIIQDNIIDSNTITTGKPQGYCDGAGISAAYNTRIINNLISNNISKREATSTYYYSSGGGISCYGVSGESYQAVITGNIISGNQLYGNLSEGGGACFGDILLTFSDNVISENYVGSLGPNTSIGGGGVVAIRALDGSVISNNIFLDNSSESFSGALNVSGSSGWNELMIVRNNYFYNNSAEDWGGALGSVDHPLLLINNVFSYNVAQYAGIGYIDKTGSTTDQHNAWIINNSFSDNSAGYFYGGFDFSNSNPVILNCLFWDNKAQLVDLIHISSGFVEMAYSLIDTNDVVGIQYYGPGIFNANPQFIDTLSLLPQVWSPCVDAGVKYYTCNHYINFSAPDYDILGNPRPMGHGVDIGAYDLTWAQGVDEINTDKPVMSTYPNPFNSEITIEYFLPVPSPVCFYIYNQLGETVDVMVNEDHSVGIHKIKWNPEGLGAGIYYCILKAGNETTFCKLVKM